MHDVPHGIEAEAFIIRISSSLSSRRHQSNEPELTYGASTSIRGNHKNTVNGIDELAYSSHGWFRVWG